MQFVTGTVQKKTFWSLLDDSAEDQPADQKCTDAMQRSLNELIFHVLYVQSHPPFFSPVSYV